MFGWLKSRRRRRIAATGRLDPDAWAAARALPALAALSDVEAERLAALTLLFLHEKRIEAAGGVVLDEAMRVRLAALACRPILGLDLDWYDNILSVIVHPAEFVVPGREEIDAAGVVHVGDDVLSGEAWEQGPIVLSLSDIVASGRGDGYNVVTHEFAHKLDALSGAMDGCPPLHRGMRSADWAASFQSAYDDLNARLDRGEVPWLDEYAAESEAEFFAVCSELFFDVPDAFAREYPAVCAQLAAFYRQVPAGR